jgi:LDH2 family malate/lactate/ureidoglycolate dehydrogenase
MYQMGQKLTPRTCLLLGQKRTFHKLDTGRVGAYSEILAKEFMWSCVFGGGGHRKLKEVAPFGARQGVFDTNPYSISMPLDGDRISHKRASLDM